MKLFDIIGGKCVVHADFLAIPEIKKYWEPRFFELFESEEDSDDKGNNPDEDSWYNPRDDFFDHWKNDDDEDDGRFDAYV